MKGKQHLGLLIRGADGELYRVSASSCERVECDETLLDDFGVHGAVRASAERLGDQASARAAIDPGDFASARAAVDPGDGLSARAAVDPGDGLSARAAVDPGDGLSARAAVDPGFTPAA